MHRFFLSLSRLMAILGGIVLSVIILMVCVSIIGRTLNSILHTGIAEMLLGGFAQTLIDIGIGPINGDYELLEAGIAFCIFAFLPLTQITAGHATVDIFTNGLPKGVQQVLFAVIEIIFAGVVVMIAWQLMHGMFDKMDRGQTTFLLQFPVWWAYALSLVGAAAAAIVGVYTALARVYQLLTGTKLIVDEGAEH
jgi:TRAP-type C4-dicarboxylate transport system permease small subunit